MTSQITDPSLLQCSRVDVLDVRPVLENGEEPFDSIQYSLSLMEDDTTLLIVAPFEPRPLKKYVEREGYSFLHEEISPRMHWLGVYSGSIDHELDINGPGPSYVLPSGSAGHIAYLDCRDMTHSDMTRWINSTLSGLSSANLLVLHCSSWNENLRKDLEGGSVSRKSIISDHVRVEIEVGDR